MKNKQYTHRRKLRIIAVAVILVWILALTLAFTWLRNTVMRDEDVLMHTQISQGYQIAKVDFCIANSIKPCDDIAIREWNAGHAADDRFVIQDSL